LAFTPSTSFAETLVNRRTFLKRAAAASTAALAIPEIPAAPTEEEHPMQVLLWCWDTRMTWDDQPDRIATKMAAAERPFPYHKDPEAFLVGFKRLIDYCAKTGIRGVTIWGFLRDAHGGVKAAQHLCAYAADRGVAILPGVGLCSYGGYYFEGDHSFNLGTYLQKHPDRASTAIEQGGGRTVSPVLDPSLEANRRWWRDGLEWMLETFRIGGIDYEMGDFIVNSSREAAAARAALGYKADDSLKDIVVATQDLMRQAITLKSDGIFINCTYRGYHQIAGFPQMPYLQGFPKETVWEYTLGGMVRRPEFPQGFTGAPNHRRYGYLHWFNASTNTTDKDYVADIARVFPGLHALDFEFAGTYGELSAITNPVADRNYRAQAAWAKNPNLTLQEFS